MSWKRFFIQVLLLCIPVHVALAAGGTLYVLPYYGVYSIGDTFDVHVLADTGGAAINAGEAVLSFNHAAFEVERITTTESILDTWPTPPVFSNEEGTIKFSGLSNEKYTGASGELVTITFKALRNMTSDVKFTEGAMLADDGVETNITTVMKSGLFTIQPKEIPARVTAAGITPSQTASAAAPAAASAPKVPIQSEGGGAESPIPAPIFSDPPTEVRAGDRIVLKGTAPANSTISIWIQQGSESPERTDVSSADDGSFTFSSDTVAVEGIYHAWAIAIGSGGVESDTSQKLTIAAHSAGLAASATFDASMLPNLVQLFAVVVFAGLGFGYLVHKHQIEKLKVQNKL